MAQTFLCGGSLVERSADLFLVANEVTGQEREGVGNEVKDTPVPLLRRRGALRYLLERGERWERGISTWKALCLRRVGRVRTAVVRQRLQE